MADKEVHVGGGLAGVGETNQHPAGDTAARKPGEGPQHGAPLDVAHLRPLSEGVLRATGHHGGHDAEGKVRDLRGMLTKKNADGEHVGAVDIDAFALTSDEPHVRSQRLEQKFHGIIERNVEKLADGTPSVVLRFTYGDGDSTTARGANQVEALDKLIAKMGGIDT